MSTSLRTGVGTILLSFAIVSAGLFARGFGMIDIGPGEVAASLFGGGDPMHAQIVRELRLPRIITAIIAGSALGVGGVLMQALFRNPMADAWSLGLTAGGQLGVALLVTAAAFSGPAAIAFGSRSSALKSAPASRIAVV